MILGFFSLLIWGMFFHRTNAEYEEKVITRENADIGAIHVSNVTGKIYDPAQLIRDYPEAKDMILMDIQPGFEFTGEPGQYIVVSCELENQSDEKVNIGSVLFPFGVKTDAWYNGYDPYVVSGFNNDAWEINPGERIRLILPVVIEKNVVSKQAWQAPQKYQFYLVLRGLEQKKYYEIPVTLAGVERATKEEKNAFIRELELYHGSY